MKNKWLSTTNPAAYLYILPAFAFYFSFLLVPLFGTAYLSVFDWDGWGPDMEYVGLHNYVRMFADPVLGRALMNTVIWVLMSYVIQIGLALFLAVLIARITIGRQTFRLMFFLPKVLSVAVVAVVWGRIYDPRIGIINQFLRVIGLEAFALAWLGNPWTVLPAVQLAHSWNGYGWYMIIYLAGLQNVDPSLYDAASVEGASGFQKFWHVTLPGIRHIHTVVLVLALIGAMQAFGTVWAMTQGGPVHRSEVLSTLIYRVAFRTFRVGYGAAMSLLVGVGIILATLVMMKMREHTNE